MKKTDSLLTVLLIGLLVAVFWPLIAKAVTIDTDGYFPQPSDVRTVALVDDGSSAFRNATSSQISTPAATLPPKPGILPSSSIQAKIEDILPPIMVKVALNESDFNPLAKNANSSAAGLFQILLSTWNGYGCTGNRYNADDNIACAKKIYDSVGTEAWNDSKYRGYAGGWAN